MRRYRFSSIVDHELPLEKGSDQPHRGGRGVFDQAALGFVAQRRSAARNRRALQLVQAAEAAVAATGPGKIAAPIIGKANPARTGILVELSLGVIARGTVTPLTPCHINSRDRAHSPHPRKTSAGADCHAGWHDRGCQVKRVGEAGP
jgi:hypothetical protein